MDYIVRLPGKSTMPFGRLKWLLKAALRGTVPNEILDGPKTGFNVPFGRWLRGPLQQHFNVQFEEFQKRTPGFIDRNTIKMWIEKDAAGLIDLSSRLWKIYNLLIWANRFQVSFAP